MATLQLRNGSYRILFCYRDRRHSFTLGRVDRREAELAASNVERLLLRIDQGLLSVPLHDDIVGFLRRDGQPALADRPPPTAPAIALGELRERYLETHGNGAIEPSTLKTARTHLGHVVVTLGADFPLAGLEASHLQRHINRRAKAKGRGGRPLSPVTIRKELAGLRAAWNWALDMGLLRVPFPGRGLTYPKTDEKPPFQTREEIERQIARGGLTAREARALWDSLFLTLPEVAEFLENVRLNATRSWLYPMACTAAHTGARRSELLRLRVHDVDLAGGTLLLREKKRAKGQRTTRRVPLSPFLAATLGDWIAGHPGGVHLFCQGPGPVQVLAPRGEPTPVTRNEAHDHLRRTLDAGRWSVVRGWHVLRHSFASNCAAGGVDQRLIDGWLGHTTEEMRKRYRHLIPSHEQQAIRGLFEGRTSGVVGSTRESPQAPPPVN
jgi:integrase